jgi:hypothetical protein
MAIEKTPEEAFYSAYAWQSILNKVRTILMSTPQMTA